MSPHLIILKILIQFRLICISDYIIFNYINLNGNAGVIMMHLGILYIISYGVYMIIKYFNFPIRKVENVAVTEEETILGTENV